MEKKNITAKILSDAKSKAEGILKEADSRAKEILGGAHQEVKRMKERLKRDAEVVAKKETARIVSLAEMEERKRILEQKIEILDDTFSRALENLKKRPKGEYQEIIKGLLVRAVNDGDEQVIVSKTDKERLDKDFFDSANSELKRFGKKGELELTEETGDFNGGVLLKKNKVETWCSVEVLLGMLRDELEMEIAKLLFETRE
ncbi:hypothetical protein AMJ40_04075 [candidate division TA06 bacterium DG_26]|uniref:V-type proton ATPase subunit E n=1 Tax=candidate division TA06 bacterium DG_26 TaxID=1703771 RepID=A0A0S7WIR3_UNCT6|nr:MAG: hypothetical protein AMJ40_04075 [candidate division TA06 bacterium DG_26]